MEIIDCGNEKSEREREVDLITPTYIADNPTIPFHISLWNSIEKAEM